MQKLLCTPDLTHVVRVSLPSPCASELVTATEEAPWAGLERMVASTTRPAQSHGQCVKFRPEPVFSWVCAKVLAPP